MCVVVVVVVVVGGGAQGRGSDPKGVNVTAVSLDVIWVWMFGLLYVICYISRVVGKTQGRI